MARETVRFLLNGEDVDARLADPSTTLLDWLRLERRLVGTKEGCAEGDCGACTVLVGKLAGESVRYEAIDSCIRLLPDLDGTHVVTVEYLKNRTGRLHPVQQAMVDLHASQCGFCTPGIVMSLLALWLESPEVPSEACIEEALAGNLCRCTGYGPIVEAMRRAYALGSPGSDAFTTERGAVAARLKAIVASGPLSFTAGGRAYHAPTTLDALDALCAAHPEATLVAGATDVGLWVTKMLQRPQTVISLGAVAGLDAVERRGKALWLGAGASVARCREALGALHPDIEGMLRRFGSAQVRNAGTIGGNIANGSPIGDLPPLLIALDATLVLRRAGQRRELPIEKFFLDYKKQDRKPGEYVEGVLVPDPPKGALIHVSKVTKRIDEDISSTLGAFRLVLGASGRIDDARLAFGGMAATPKRAARAEAALKGQVWSLQAAEAAAAALAQDFTPLDDWRASARYRARVAANLILRFHEETSSGDARRVTDAPKEAAHA